MRYNLKIGIDFGCWIWFCFLFLFFTTRESGEQFQSAVDVFNSIVQGTYMHKEQPENKCSTEETSDTWQKGSNSISLDRVELKEVQ